MTVIYVDVLFIVNFFITFLLLLITEKLAKREDKLIRKILSSLAGGAYSLVILADELDFLVSLLGKLAAACIIILIAFKPISVKIFVKETLLFFFVNFVFVGIISGLWMIFKPQGVAVNNATVYFDVSAKALLASALIAYIITAAALKIYNNKLSKRELYRIKIYVNGACVKLFAFADNGNNLKEPFSDYPVVVVDEELFKEEECNRVIPVSTVSGEGVLRAFRPEKIVVSTSRGECVIERVYVALSSTVKKGEYQGIINPKIINEVDYASKN